MYTNHLFMTQKRIILKPGKDKPIRHHHHWIFSGAVSHYPQFKDGDVLPVYSSEGELLGSGYFNRACNIVGRMLSFDSKSAEEALKKHLDQAITLRKSLFLNQQTNAFRLVNGEGDALPGLIIDCYHDILVLQITTKGMENFRSWLVNYLIEVINPRAILEKSLSPSRKEEGLQPMQQWLYGNPVNHVSVLENGLKFSVDLIEGQKTGFFLDQREMRLWVKNLSNQKRVLNCFSYSGAFTVYAIAGGAQEVDSVDISEKALETAKENLALNNFQSKEASFFADDVFEFLRTNSLDYDLIILDPPAFAKRQKEVIAACRGYKDINRLAIQKMPPMSLLLTCSCSYHVDADLFQKVIFQAAYEAKREVKIIGYHRLAADHPINIYHPEGDYLKSLLLFVT